MTSGGEDPREKGRERVQRGVNQVSKDKIRGKERHTGFIEGGRTRDPPGSGENNLKIH